MSSIDAPRARSHRRHPSSALSAAATALLLCLGGLGLAPAAAADASPSPTAGAPASASPSASPTAQLPVPAPTGARVSPSPATQVSGGYTTDGCGTLAQTNWGWLPVNNDAKLTVQVPQSTAPLTVEFHFYDAARPGTDLLSGPAETVDASGLARFTVPTANLADGHSYGWHAVTRDAAGRTSAPTVSCHFRIDRTPPTVTLKDVSEVARIGSWNQLYDWTDQPAADGTKVQYICAEVRYDNSPNWGPPSCDYGAGRLYGSPQAAGPTVAHIRTVDPAGNRSAEVTRPLYVYPNANGGDLADPFAHWLLDRGTQGADGFGRSPLTASGPVAWADYTKEPWLPSTTFASLDGTGSLGSAQAVVDTTKSFSVNVYAKAADATSGGIVVSQDGTRSSGFILWADPADQHWRFSIGTVDSDNPVWDNTDHDAPTAGSNGTDYGRVQSAGFQRLTASYNAGTGAMALYVDGQLASTGHHDPAKSWKANGPLRVGQYQFRGRPDFRFKGLVGDLALVARPVGFPTENARYQEPASRSLNVPGCMDTSSTEANAPGKRIRFVDCSTSPSGLSAWRTDGTVRQSGLCLDVAYNATANGSVLQLWDCNGGANQQWIPQADGTLYNPVSGRCVDLPWGNRVFGTAMALWDCNGGVNQVWSPLHPLMNGPR
ncbi:ricin-type beta-trefoil lectin domain protein [Kitasatospora phosalacinea]|uniref:ricin-type beta-trefoil lectin domain protein n=1 Tax=Kitasatospora phosalacinea TaxID=2065 RepID=UPI00365B6408